MNPYFNRMLRAAKLEPDLYEEVEHDKSAMGQALGVILLSSIAAGIGSANGGEFVMGILAAMIGWFL